MIFTKICNIIVKVMNKSVTELQCITAVASGQLGYVTLTTHSCCDTRQTSIRKLNIRIHRSYTEVIA